MLTVLIRLQTNKKEGRAAEATRPDFLCRLLRAWDSMPSRGDGDSNASLCSLSNTGHLGHHPNASPYLPGSSVLVALDTNDCCTAQELARCDVLRRRHGHFDKPCCYCSRSRCSYSHSPGRVRQ